MNEILINIIVIVFEVLWWAILIRVLLSWLPMAGVQLDRSNPVINILYTITDPILEPLRRYTTVGMIDLSPLVALIGLRFLEQILVSLLR